MLLRLLIPPQSLALQVRIKHDSHTNVASYGRLPTTYIFYIHGKCMLQSNNCTCGLSSSSLRHYFYRCLPTRNDEPAARQCSRKDCGNSLKLLYETFTLATISFEMKANPLKQCRHCNHAKDQKRNPYPSSLQSLPKNPEILRCIPPSHPYFFQITSLSSIQAANPGPVRDHS